VTRRAAILGSLLLGLPALALVAALLLLDGATLRPRLIAAAETATGRPVTIGEVGLALSLTPTLTLKEVGVGNLPGGSRPQMLTARHAEVTVALWPLLAGRVEIRRILLDAPDLLLERDADGRGNWSLARPAAPPGPAAPVAPAPARPPARPVIDLLEMRGAQITWRGASPLTITLPRLTLRLPATGEAVLEAEAERRGEPLALRLRGDPALLAGGPAPITAELRGLGVTVTATGQVVDGALTAQLTATAPDLRGLAPGLPPLGPLAAGAVLVAGPSGVTLSDIRLALGPAEPLPGLRLQAARAETAGLDAPLALAVEAARGGTPIRLTGQAAPLRDLGAETLPFDLALAAGESRVTARGTLASGGARPRLVLALSGPLLDLDALSAPPPGPAAPAAAPANPAPPPDPRVIPRIPIPFAALTMADAAITLDLGRLIAGGQAMTAVRAEARLRDGVLALDPFAATLPAGPLEGRLALQAADQQVALRLASPSLDLAGLATMAGQRAWLAGPAELDLDVAGRGADTRAVAGSLGGTIGIALVDGAIARAAVAAVPDAALRLLMPGGLPAGDLALRCLAVAGVAEAGVLRLSTLHADSALLRAGGTGLVQLSAETLALRLNAEATGGRIALRAPVEVAGPWLAPRLAVEPGAAAAAGLAAMLATQASPDRTLSGLAESLAGRGAALPGCGPALAAARGGRAGALPAQPEATPAPAPAPAAPRAGDLLRGLLGR
jgi:uncharacterized protein involved in outer membrane biogenesis